MLPQGCSLGCLPLRFDASPSSPPTQTHKECQRFVAGLHLKLYYLRTREKRASQQAVADAIGIRQATLSHLERGVSAPNSSLLLQICEYYDVTPTFLLDEERPVVPVATERWRMRNGLVTAGMWIEAPSEAVVQAKDGKVLCPLLAGEVFFDEEALAVRMAADGLRNLEQAMERHEEERARLERELQRELERELSEHPQRRATRS